MDGIDWTMITQEQLEAFEKRTALVETWLDESIDEAQRLQVRQAYRDEHGVSERTIRNYIRRYQQQGRHGLLFYQKHKPPSPRIHDRGLRDKILAMMEERPGRTVPQLRRILINEEEYAPLINKVSDRSIYRFLQEEGLTRKVRMTKRADLQRTAYHRFEADCSMKLVQGDARDGIWLPRAPGETSMRKTYLFAWMDDYSRRILHAQYFWDEKLPRMEETFKTMILRWGIPDKVYLDNGSVYIAAQFALTLADLNIKKIHHGPYQAWCKGKMESGMKTFKQEFQGEAQYAGFRTLEELNTALWAWIDVEYNRRSHTSTGETPQGRFERGLRDNQRRVKDLEWFEGLFLLRVNRKVTKYGEIKLEGNLYQTKAPYGTVVEIRYNPFDLGQVWRFEKGKAVEPLRTKKLLRERAKVVAEERPDAPQKISKEAAGYFQSLRESHASLAKQVSATQYSKLKNQEVSS